LSGGSEEADEGVAEDGVAEVADVGGFVGIDAGVFDERVNLLHSHQASRVLAKSSGVNKGDGGDAGGAVEVGVDVSGAGDFKTGEASESTQRGHDFLGDDFGGFAELAGEFEGDGGGEFAEFEVGWNLEGDGLDIEGVVCL